MLRTVNRLLFFIGLLLLGSFSAQAAKFEAVVLKNIYFDERTVITLKSKSSGQELDSSAYFLEKSSLTQPDDQTVKVVNGTEIYFTKRGNGATSSSSAVFYINVYKKVKKNGSISLMIEEKNFPIAVEVKPLLKVTVEKIKSPYNGKSKPTAIRVNGKQINSGNYKIEITQASSNGTMKVTQKDGTEIKPVNGIYSSGFNLVFEPNASARGGNREEVGISLTHLDDKGVEEKGKGKVKAIVEVSAIKPNVEVDKIKAPYNGKSKPAAIRVNGKQINSGDYKIKLTQPKHNGKMSVTNKEGVVDKADDEGIYSKGTHLVFEPNASARGGNTEEVGFSLTKANGDGKKTVKGKASVEVLSVRVSSVWERFRYKSLIGVESSQKDGKPFAKQNLYVNFLSSTLLIGHTYDNEHYPTLLGHVNLLFANAPAEDPLSQKAEVKNFNAWTGSLGVELNLSNYKYSPLNFDFHPNAENVYGVSLITNIGVQTMTQMTLDKQLKNFWNIGARIGQRERMKSPYHPTFMTSYVDVTYGRYAHLPSGDRKKWAVEAFLELPDSNHTAVSLKSVVGRGGWGGGGNSLSMRISTGFDMLTFFSSTLDALKKTTSGEAEKSE